MTDKSVYPFRIGDFECLSISDGTFVVPDTVTPRPFSPANPKSGLVMDMNCLLIQAGRRKILVDTGCGKWFGEKSGKLVTNLDAAGISTSEIDTVVITHAHGDHIGANADSTGKPVFGKARYIFHRDEWQYWTDKLKETSEGSKDLLSMTRHNLLSIRDQVDLIEDKENIVPGIEAALVPGHTPGHIMLLISSGKDRLCCISDLIHHTAELVKPEIFTIFDVDPDKATAARKKTPLELADPGLLLWSCHLNFPGLGHFVRLGSTLIWRPIDNS